MKLRYAKLWLKKYIKYNYNKLDENKLNRAIINLSHRVYKSHGTKGHNVRQHIRGVLVDYSKEELSKYNVVFEKPLKIKYKQRLVRLRAHRTSNILINTILFILKIIGLGILLFIIWYISYNLLK